MELGIIVWALLVIWTVYLANKNGRNQIIALIAGIFLGLLAVIIYAIMGKTQELKDEDFIKKMEAYKNIEKK